MAQLSSSEVFGNIDVYGDVSANRVYNAAWNDVAEFMIYTGNKSKPGDVLVMTKEGVTISSKVGMKSVVGIHSDSYGYALGSDKKEIKTPVGLIGRVDVKLKEPCQIGDLIISDKDGFGKVKKWYNKSKGRVIGKVMKNKTTFETERIEVLLCLL